MLYSTVLFDLDGTLLESGPGIFRATNAMLQELGRAPREQTQLRPLIGPPLRMGFSKILGFPASEIERAVTIYRHYYETRDHVLVHPFPGVKIMLEGLRACGIRTGVVTSKVEAAARRHLAAYELAGLIDYVRGAAGDGSGEKTELLRLAVEDLNLQGEALASCVMVGDRYFDLNGAHNVGMDCIGVTYGYGEKEELVGCNPTYLVNTVPELHTLLTAGNLK